MMGMRDNGINGITSLLYANCEIYAKTEDDNEIHLYGKTCNSTGVCPKCGTVSNKLHATYERILQDTPIHNKRTLLHIKVHKYNCTNTKCRCKVFSEILPFAKKQQVRTNALTHFILYVASFLGNETASKVLKLLGVLVSNDTIQRMYDGLHFKDDPDVEEIGIDDAAIRKGKKYATAIYDLKDHHLIDLLDGRDGETLKEWLKKHPKVRLVARDRASAYASAVDDILPNCVQVADRFHLLQNLMDHIKGILKEEIPSEIFVQDGQVLDEKPKPIAVSVPPSKEILDTLQYDNTPPISEDGQVMNYDSKRRDPDSAQYKTHAKKRQAKQQVIRELQKRCVQPGTKQIKKLAEEFHLSPLTVKKYLNMTEMDIQKLEQPRNYKKRTTIMDDYLNIIYKMLHDAIEPETIYAYICYKGYQGNMDSLHKYIYLLEKNNFRDRSPHNPYYNMTQQYPQGVLRFKRIDLMKHLLTCNQKTKMEPLIAANINVIKDKYPCADSMAHIFHQFYDSIMGQDPQALDVFIAKHQDSAIRSFCTGLKKDIAPVKNAISLPISSGFVEGNNNKFKLIKRIVYGRSSIVNLAKKCKLAFSYKIPDFNLSDIM